MDNPETHAALGKRHRTKTNKTNDTKLIRGAIRTPPPGIGAHEGYTVSASYKTPFMLIIY